jgi:hypothetical protein
MQPRCRGSPKDARSRCAKRKRSPRYASDPILVQSDTLPRVPRDARLARERSGSSPIRRAKLFGAQTILSS